MNEEQALPAARGSPGIDSQNISHPLVSASSNFASIMWCSCISAFETTLMASTPAATSDASAKMS